MAKVYYRKIKEQEINQNTGEVWCLEDVPRRWRETVKGLLENES